jgi:5'-methylthioinosine phosphorylase
MRKIAIIGGTGLTALSGLAISHQQTVLTPFGEPSAPVIFGTYHDSSMLFLARHGTQHTIPPHKINYRANIWALKHLGVTDIIAVAAVGGIAKEMQPGDLVIPHQLIDYTWGREPSFFSENLTEVTHIDFTHPYCESLRTQLLKAAQSVKCRTHEQGIYGVTQGPRLETVAEINRMERDGCDIVGMTAMPEAALARELGICYAACAVVANEAAGRSPVELTMADIEHNLLTGMQNARELLTHWLATEIRPQSP